MARVKDQLRSLNVRPSKSRGQNFVIAPAVIETIVGFGNPKPQETVIEIGPGLGALTGELVSRGLKGVIEIEENFCAALKQRYPDLAIIQRDVREVDFASLGLGTELTVFGNLPYAFSTDIIFHLIANKQVVKRAVLLLQREFSERLASPPGSRSYGVLSISCQLDCAVNLGPIISGNSFHPPTKVESRLVELTFLPEPVVAVADIEGFKKVVRAAFSQRRRKMLNSVLGSGMHSKEAWLEAFEKAGIDSGRRAETLSLQEFAAFYAALPAKQKSVTT